MVNQPTNKQTNWFEASRLVVMAGDSSFTGREFESQYLHTSYGGGLFSNLFFAKLKRPKIVN